MIRVLIDATGVTKKKAGVGVYAKNLIDELVNIQGLELFLVVQDDDPDLHYFDHPHVTLLRMSSRLLRKVVLRLFFEQTFLPLLIRKHRIDVVHSLHYSFPLFRFGARSVVTFHDMTWLAMPEVHTGIKLRYFRFFIRRSPRWSDAVIFVSRSAQEDFVARLGPPRGLSVVVHHGKSDLFRAEHNPLAITATCEKYHLPARYILYVGTIEPRKNLERLVKAFSTLALTFPDVSIVLAGMMGWKQKHLVGLVDTLGIKDRVIFPGFVAEEDKATLIAGSEIFVYVSLYEGFGLPVLEALASGVPTITSNLSSLPEVAGDAALLIDPKSETAIADAIEAILSDSVLRTNLRFRGPLQAAKFSWKKAAEETATIYVTLGHRNGR